MVLVGPHGRYHPCLDRTPIIVEEARVDDDPVDIALDVDLLVGPLLAKERAIVLRQQSQQDQLLGLAPDHDPQNITGVEVHPLRKDKFGVLQPDRRPHSL